MRKHPLAGPVEDCAVCIKDGFEDCNQHEDCEGEFCNGDDDGNASLTSLSRMAGEDGGGGWLDLGPICIAKYRERHARHAAWESRGDYARDMAKDALVRR
jgi:hypothetical protein